MSGAWRFICVLLAGVVLLAQQPLNRAWELAAKGQRPEAIRTLRVLIETDPKNVDARLLLGSLLMEDGERAGSIEQLTTAVRLRPNSAEAENALGEAYNNFGDVAGARAAFQRAVSIDPRYGIGQFNLGQTLLAAADAAKAAPHLDQAIRLLGRADDAADAHYLRAKIYMAEGAAQQAAAHLEQAVSIRANFAAAWSDLGQARRTLLDDAGALTAFQRAVDSNPGDAVAQYRLGAEYLRQNEPHLAAQHLEKANQLNATDQSTLNSLQIALRQDGRTDEANGVKQKLSELLQEKDRVNQNQLKAVKLNNEGVELQKSGDLLGAVAKYREAANLYPEHVGIRVNYAVALLRLGHWAEGLDELHEAMRREPGNALIRATLKDALAQAPASAVPKWKEELQ
jgi:tetratricopeptide (TPR) repeat protein